MIHDSQVILTLISICNSWINLLNPIHTLLLYMLSVRSMNHESRILNHPTSNPDEDAHTIAPINPWKFQIDWSSHVRAYSVASAGNGLSPHTPLYTYAGCAGWMRCQIFTCGGARRSTSGTGKSGRLGKEGTKSSEMGKEGMKSSGMGKEGA